MTNKLLGKKKRVTFQDLTDPTNFTFGVAGWKDLHHDDHVEALALGALPLLTSSTPLRATQALQTNSNPRLP